jgi:tetratricopeptide (TPR) repeat protein
MDSLRERASAADDADDVPLAFELWGKLVEDDTDGIAWLKYGALAIQLEKWDVAESALMEASRLKPRASIVMALLGGLWSERTDRDRVESLQTAKQWYLRSLERKRIAPTLTLLGSVCIRLGEIDEAKAAFEEAIVIDSNYDEAMYNLAVLEKESDPQRCVALLKQAVEIDPQYSMAHQALGRSLQKLGDLAHAEQHFRKCLEIHPDDYWSWLYLANLLGVRGRNEEAERSYRSAIAIQAEEVAGLKFFANFLKSIGKGTEAAEIRSKVAGIASKD